MFAQWMFRLVESELGTGPMSTGFGAGEFILARADGSVVLKIRRDPGGAGWMIDTDQVAPERVGQLAAQALASVAKDDYGEDMCYSAEFVLHDPQILSSGGLDTYLIQILSDQVAISGKRRLHNVALLDFQPDSRPPGLFVPQTRIQAVVFAPGPGPGRGPLSD